VGGARALESLAGDLDALVREKRLTSIPGIGPALAAVITDLHETGRSSFLEEVRARFRPGALELSRVPGMTPRRVAAVQETLGIEDVAELKGA
jgi:DNA polymerase (family 10)